MGSNPTGPTKTFGTIDSHEASLSIKADITICKAVQEQEESPSAEQIREFVTAAHWNLPRVKEMLEANPKLLNASYRWTEIDRESPIQAAAQLGSTEVAEYLLSKGAPLEICTAAMLGKRNEVETRLDADPQSAKAVGAHGIPLLPHSVWSGNLDLIKRVYARGATAGSNLALHNAVARGNPDIVDWLVENTEPDIEAKNYQGKTPLTVAKERNAERIILLLRKHGAKD